MSLTSSITGLSLGHGISGVRFVNYRYGGRPCRSPADADLDIGPRADRVTFKIAEP